MLLVLLLGRAGPGWAGLGRARLGTPTVLENVHKSILGFGEDLGTQEEGEGECWGNLNSPQQKCTIRA